MKITYIDDGYFEKLRKKDNKAFIGCVNVDAIDSYRAVEFAYARLEIFISFYRVISNRNKEIIGKTAYVRNCETEEELYIPVLPEGFKNIEIDLDDGLYIQGISNINELRRQALAQYEEKLIHSFKKFSWLY